MKYCDICHSTYPTEFTTCPKDQGPLRMVSDLAPGMVIREKYEILEKIGVGGMATVYKAKHLTFNEIRAIKLVSNKLMDDDNFLKRFKAEAIITRKLRHPNAVQLDDFDTTEDGRPFIVMEYVQGKSLRSWIHDTGALPVPRALNIAKQVAAALGAAHKLGIVHRDIKPDNIIVVAPSPTAVAQDAVKVFDFGIAKIRGGTADIGASGSSTQTGMVVGTPQYVSPEQASGKIGDLIDGRSDLYSLGVVLYEMLTGKLPFKSDTPIGFLIQHMQAAPTPPQALKPRVNLPESINQLLMKALEKDREQRFQTAEEFIAALNRPHAYAPTAVMGSDALRAPTLQTPRPTAQAASPGAPSQAATRAVAPPAWKPPAAPSQAAVPAAPARPPQKETVFGEEKKESVWSGKRNGSNIQWNKVLLIALLLVAVGLGGIWYMNQPPSNSSATTQVNTLQEDARIKQDVEDALTNSDTLKHRPIKVSVENGVVTLRGTVPKPYESEIAGSLAANVTGVRNVKNDIEILEVVEKEEPVWRSEKGATPGNPQSQQSQPSQNVIPPVTHRNPKPLDPAVAGAVQQYNARGYRRLGMRDYKGAERFFQNALDLAPNNRAALEGLRRAQQAETAPNR